MDEPAGPELTTRLQFAQRIAAEAGQRLLAIRASGRWSDPEVLGDVADQAADGYLQGAVRARFGEDGILSEETKDAPQRLSRPWTWIVDPLDGTKEYRAGRHDWAVHVGLAWRRRAVAGALALPSIARSLAGAPGGGAQLEAHGGEGGEWPRAIPADRGSQQPLRIVCSRSHTPSLVQHLADELGAELVPCGSVGFKVAMLVFGRAELYVHKKGLHEWDVCAPDAVARAAGFVVCNFAGQEHRYNAPDPRCDELVVCRPWLRDRVLALLAARR
jgi:3'(2'), 5'-bisphosphate nucleotidase